MTTQEITTLTETEEDVLRVSNQYLAHLMTDDDWDGYVKDTIFPRYMKMTVDRVKLSPSWWAAQTGATSNAIANRVKRLRTKASEGSEEVSQAVTTSQKGQIRGAKSALKKHPELVEKLIDGLTPEVKLAMTEQLANDPDVIDTVEGRQVLVSGVGRSTAREDVRDAKGKSATGGTKVANEAGVFAGATHLLTAYSGLKKFNEWATDLDERDVALTDEQKGELTEMMPSIDTELDIAKLKIL